MVRFRFASGSVQFVNVLTGNTVYMKKYLKIWKDWDTLGPGSSVAPR